MKILQSKILWKSVCILFCLSLQFTSTLAQETKPFDYKSNENLITVLTYNVLRPEWGRKTYPGWDQRKEIVQKVIQQANADFVGLQEESESQLRDILSANQELTLAGKHPGIGGSLLYRADRWELKHFEMLRVPERDQGSAKQFMRPIQVAQFKHKTTAQTLTVINLHLTPFSSWARQEAVKKIQAYLKEKKIDRQLVVMGDFNARETQPTMIQLLDHKALPLASTLARFENISFKERQKTVQHAEKIFRDSRQYQAGKLELDQATLQSYAKYRNQYRKWGTLHAFSGHPYTLRIDYILVTSDIQVLNSETLQHGINGTQGSDHYPVLAVLRMKSKS